ncbi:MAG TPA: nucleotidyl transferase AbiEii/AbiGii toxin family protein [Kiritimatiellia bacterium]|nr:nucleotidyl transferase AbiEii/AbiGii toxin family protein [Kiritimatiellia bacterium]
MIGGLAVNHYGYSRATADIDFMIVASDAANIRRTMTGYGFVNVDERENVIFFSQPGQPVRVDFLRVDHNTMMKLLDDAQSVEFQGRLVMVPSVSNLIAMKLFALKQSWDRRMAKDLPDIVTLARIHELDPEQNIKPLALQFADEFIYQQVVKNLAAQ